MEINILFVEACIQNHAQNQKWIKIRVEIRPRLIQLLWRFFQMSLDDLSSVWPPCDVCTTTTLLPDLDQSISHSWTPVLS